MLTLQSGAVGRSLLLVASLVLLCRCSGPALARWFEAQGAAAIGGVAVVQAGSLSVEVQECYASARMSLLAEAGLTVDPFAVSRGSEPMFRTFLVTIENRGQDVARYNPSFTSLELSAEDRRYPLGYTELYSFLRESFEVGVPFERLASLLAETSVAIAPGARREILLVFNRIESKQRKATLDLVGLDTAEQPVAVRLEFRRRALD